jgi:hypothetical protein
MAEPIAKLLTSRKSMILAPVAKTRIAGLVSGGSRRASPKLQLLNHFRYIFLKLS